MVLGGTLTEVAIRQGRVDGLVAWLRELGLRHVEISDGTIALEAAVKHELIERLSREFVVLAEVGSKDADFIMAPYIWVEQIERDLDAGAWKVIAEARESGTAGIYRADGEVRTGLIDEIAHAVDPERLIFDAPLQRAAGVAAQALRHRVQPRQHRARRRAFARDAAAGASLGHGRALRAGRRGLTETAAGVDGAPNGARSPAAGSDPVAGIVFAALLVACFAAFLITQRLKHTPTAVQQLQARRPSLPTPKSHDKLEEISFELANAEAVTVTIIDSNGNTVATLLGNYPAPRYKDVSLRWNGHRGTAHRYGRLITPGGRSIPVPDNEGPTAPAGEYRVSLNLHNHGQVLLPRSFSLVRP